MTVLEQCQAWHEQDKHNAIVNTLEALPDSQRTAETDMELARAYNNLADPGKVNARDLLWRAIHRMEPHRSQLQDTYSWNFRMGYAYYYLDMGDAARPYLERALALHPGDDPSVNTVSELREMIDGCVTPPPPQLDPDTGSILTREDIDFLRSCHEGTYGYFYKMLHHLYELIQRGIEEGRFTEVQARQDLQLALWFCYACNNTDTYEYYYQAAMWMPDSEAAADAAGCGMWYYRYACALVYCGRLSEARRYAETGALKDPGYPWTWLLLGKLRAHDGCKTQALEAVQKGLALVPGDYEFLTLQQEILAGASLEQMEYHWIDPTADGDLQDGQGPQEDADEKMRVISCIVTDPKRLRQFYKLFRCQPTDYERNCPYCTLHYKVRRKYPVDLVFRMNEAAISKIDPDWLRLQKERLDDGRWLTRRARLDVTGTLDTVLIDLGRTVSLIYKVDGAEDQFFQVWLDSDGNLTSPPDSGEEDGADDEA
ncbi:hypothetical protein B5G12_07325 [Faecalibacterium sp. An58]|uniref:hypothetical protein n=1 Tax=Faecalibacterium sp. An58 TaxID=1965648 RepID=UPI000B36AB62|nr:hypothetical protein [Faecalibacterium sp. An58]OUN73329.1 hypothetical protein B5G12_07325 [Faecalibacterium sp. An58]